MWKGVTTRARLTRTPVRSSQHLQTPQSLVSSMRASRPFSAIAPLHARPEDGEYPHHDRHSLDPSRTEASQSGTTDEVASRDSAFDPSKTSPESEISASKEESEREGRVRDPLGVSAGDKDVGRERDPMEVGADKNAGKVGPSTRGWTKKNRETKAARK
ncbi:uncharacterized protein BJX67DRAFT_279731 [Aspergillus lucknowensis]|uniref:Uncharacterized protein n=1 Tax=Aspergillus lucknowensis TaxID=176173 RepID=A0ABR4M0R4_9EURO